MPEGGSKKFLVQWHVTARCDQKCKHCYVYDNDTYNKELKNELSYGDCIRILDDIHATVTKVFKRELKINFSGGDPLLRSDFIDLLAKAKSKNIQIGILGNPHHITKKVAKDLYRIGLSGYQVSIDGMEEIHDRIRGKGSFNTTIKGIRTLKETGIPVAVMFTISKINQNDFLEVVKLCHIEKVNIFAFDSVVPIGNADKNFVLTAQEMREIMFQYFQLTQDLKESGSKTSFRKKGNLWTLLEMELGLETKLVNVSRKSAKICAGCTVGINSLSILSNGDVYPCRRLPIKIGKFPEQTLKEVFLGENLNKLRQERKIEKCGSCELFNVCRGCRALAYAVNGDYFSSDPHCWKK